MMAYLKKVCLSAEIYAVCLSHALSTEKEEVMGLLIGKVCIKISENILLFTMILYF